MIVSSEIAAAIDKRHDHFLTLGRAGHSGK
jgi:hypothetical protein